MIKKSISNLKNSINGLKLALSESSFVAELVGGLILIIYLFLSDLNLMYKLLIIVIYILLLAFELLNTAIERLSNKINLEFDEDIKSIKDISSSAVFLVLIILIFLIFLTLFM